MCRAAALDGLAHPNGAWRLVNLLPLPLPQPSAPRRRLFACVSAALYLLVVLWAYLWRYEDVDPKCSDPWNGVDHRAE